MAIIISRDSKTTFSPLSIRAVISGNVSDLPDIFEAPLSFVEPEAPILSGGALDWLSILLTWESASAVSYEIHESTTGSGGSYSIISSPSIPSLSLEVAGFDPEETRHYKMKAVGSSGSKSEFSNIVEVSAASLPAPTLSTLVVDLEDALMSWISNSLDTEDTFRIERSLTSGSGFSEVGNVSTGVLTFEDTGPLDHGTDYYWRVRARLNGVNSAYSNEITGTTLTMDAPSGLIVTPSLDSIQVDYIINSEGEEDGFRLEVSDDGLTGWSSADTASTGETTMTHTGRIWGTTKYYRVIATESEGESAPSEVVAGTTLTLAAPSSIVFSSITLEGGTATWTSNSGGNEDDFVLQRSDDGSSGWANISVNASGDVDFDDTGLIWGEDYFYRVLARKDGKFTEWSAVNSFTTLTLSAPDTLTATSNHYYEVALTWNLTDSGSEDFTVIERSGNGGVSYRQIATVAQGVETFLDEYTDGSKTYDYRVAASFNGKLTGYDTDSVSTENSAFNFIDSNGDFFIDSNLDNFTNPDGSIADLNFIDSDGDFFVNSNGDNFSHNGI